MDDEESITSWQQALDGMHTLMKDFGRDAQLGPIAGQYAQQLADDADTTMMHDEDKARVRHLAAGINAAIARRRFVPTMARRLGLVDQMASGTHPDPMAVPEADQALYEQLLEADFDGAIAAGRNAPNPASALPSSDPWYVPPAQEQPSAPTMPPPMTHQTKSPVSFHQPTPPERRRRRQDASSTTMPAPRTAPQEGQGTLDLYVPIADESHGSHRERMEPVDDVRMRPAPGVQPTAHTAWYPAESPSERVDRRAQEILESTGEAIDPQTGCSF